MTTQTNLPDTVRAYMKFKGEINDANAALKEMRAEMRACEARIYEYMKTQNRKAIKTRRGRIDLVQRKKRAPANRAQLHKVLTSMLPNGDADNIVKRFYDDRPATNVESVRLKMFKPKEGGAGGTLEIVDDAASEMSEGPQ